MGEAVEHFLVETFIAQLANERLHEAILLGLARSDVMPCDACLFLPFQNGTAGQFCAVVRHDGLRLTVESDAAVQFASHTGNCQLR